MATTPDPNALSTTAAALPPEELTFASGRYVVRSVLGVGGQKVVYLVHDGVLGRDCALASISAERLETEDLARLRGEAQAMAQLGTNPNIVSVFDFGEEGGKPYLVCEYVSGGDLRRTLHEAAGPLTLDRTLAIANDVCAALSIAHRRGVVHRDIKPANIWLTEEGVAKLGDFGLSLALGRARVTMDGAFIGTASYMAPEQARGLQVDARSDLYALGAVLYEMTTGQPPFRGDDVISVISQHINTSPVPPTWHNATIPRALEALILQLLAKAPDARPASADAVRSALQTVSGVPASQPVRIPDATRPFDRLAGGVYVGRDEEARELRAGLEDMLAGHGHLLLVAGEPGIGKTRLAEELATFAQMRGVQVLWGHCAEEQGAPGYWPWVQIIRAHVDDRGPDALLSEMGSGAAEIAQIVSEVRARLPDLPSPPALEPEQARFRLWDSVTTFLKNAAKTQPLVLMIEDLHWADASSMLLLQFLARDIRAARILVVCTYRDIELGRQQILARALAELSRDPRTQRIALSGLAEIDVARFIEMTAGREPTSLLVSQVYRQSEGNPFFVHEIVRLLVGQGRLDDADGTSTWSPSVPESVREVIGRRLESLSKECNDVLATASVIGREFDLRILSRASHFSSARLTRLLEEAVTWRIVAEQRSPSAGGAELGHYMFSHALIRDTLYEKMRPARCRRLHGTIAAALEGVYGANSDRHLAELAYHLCEAAPAGDVSRAIDCSLRAGERSLRQCAYEEAAVQFQRAARVLELRPVSDDLQKYDLLFREADAWSKAGQPTRAREMFEEVGEAARRLRAPELLARAAIEIETLMEAGDYVASVALLEEALLSLSGEDSVLRARIQSGLARALVNGSPEYERAVALSQDGAEMARRLGDYSALGYCLGSRHFVLFPLGSVQERLAVAEQIIALGERTQNKALVLQGSFFRAQDLLELGEIDEADAVADACITLADEVRLPLYYWFREAYRAMRATFEGRFAEAEPLVAQCFAAGQRVQTGSALLTYTGQTFSLRWAQGRLQELEGPIKVFVAQYATTMPVAHAALAFLASELGQTEEARSAFARMATDKFAAVPRDPNWLITTALLASVCSDLNDRERAAELYEGLLPYAGRNILGYGGVVYFGSTSRCLGRLAATSGRWAEAANHFEQSLLMDARMRARPFLAHTQYDYAKMLLARGAAGDLRRASELLGEAITSARGLEMNALLQNAEALRARLMAASPEDGEPSLGGERA